MWTDFDRFGLYGPWRAFDRLHRTTSGVLSQSTSDFPAINVWADGDNHVLTAELPGIEPKDVEISIAGRSVTIRGIRKTDEPCEGECVHRQERWEGKFTRSIELPHVIDQNKVEAIFSKGVLQVVLPRAESDKPRKIAIKTE
ncbi:MAG: Hsp20/alpha crystallin family protein [Nitrospirota bacterium]